MRHKRFMASPQAQDPPLVAKPLGLLKINILWVQLLWVVKYTIAQSFACVKFQRCNLVGTKPPAEATKFLVKRVGRFLFGDEC
jgi:hypothetical protein